MSVANQRDMQTPSICKPTTACSILSIRATAFSRIPSALISFEYRLLFLFRLFIFRFPLDLSGICGVSAAIDFKGDDSAVASGINPTGSDMGEQVAKQTWESSNVFGTERASTMPFDSVCWVSSVDGFYFTKSGKRRRLVRYCLVLFLLDSRLIFV